MPYLLAYQVLSFDKGFCFMCKQLWQNKPLIVTNLHEQRNVLCMERMLIM
ncbi:hypothetical protein BAOM_1294 [Peribacillus asahii]|uniref:Uncharacterized protein n=1 Tax=Peribacillus asahii TaxID=228899 RepID=A0A3T0KNR4_9BACI|nr:hypothetical protein BAOM_1294 [Peribacillus asahii]